MTEGEMLRLLLQAVRGQRSQMTEQDVIDAEYYQPPTPPVPTIMAPVDAIDMIEHLENERAARDCDCE